ncbi:MAG: DMT family transporter [Alphaproteobacteria bacterium]|jgi:drug/metabolite transporter (DMT)-like permease|nr:DMT family transporter [Alphaproteobacteria bacterium]
MSDIGSPGRLIYSAVLLIALVSVAHAAIFVRMADANPLVIAAYRMLIASAVLLPIALLSSWQEIRGLSRRQWVLMGTGAIFLALHFATWIEGVQRTSIANAVVLVTLTPVWLALWALLVLRRSPGKRVWSAVGLAVCGSAIMAWGSLQLGLQTLLGDGLALVGGLFFAAFFVVAEDVRRSVGLLAFVALVYAGAAILLWVPVSGLGMPVAGFSAETYFALVALGLVSQVIGHSGFNWAVRAISPMFLALLLLAEPILSAAFGWVYFREGFGLETVIGGGLILGAIYLGVRAESANGRVQTG